MLLLLDRVLEAVPVTGHLLALATLLPFIIASGTCYIKFSIVFVMVRNALSLQHGHSNLNPARWIKKIFSLRTAKNGVKAMHYLGD